MAGRFRRFGVHLVALDPTVGAEIRKTRPCVIVSPDVANDHLKTVVVVPLTSSKRPYPTRVDSRFGGVDGQFAIDQLRAVAQDRCRRRLGEVTQAEQASLLNALALFFAR